MRTLKSTWWRLSKRRQGWGFGIPVHKDLPSLTELRFADDILLIACCKADVKKMLEHLQAETAKYGLKLNVDKTKIMTNTHVAEDSSVEIRGEATEILTCDSSQRYLGRKLCINSLHETELSNRRSAAWKNLSALIMDCTPSDFYPQVE